MIERSAAAISQRSGAELERLLANDAIRQFGLRSPKRLEPERRLPPARPKEEGRLSQSYTNESVVATNSTIYKYISA
jgi:hypothetical protein